MTLKTIFQTAEIPIAASVVTLLQQTADKKYIQSVKKLRKPFLTLLKKLLISREKFPGARVFVGGVFSLSNGNLLFFNQCHGPTTLRVSCNKEQHSSHAKAQDRVAILTRKKL